MPFRSRAQMRYLFATNPELAKKWAKKSKRKKTDLSKLPEKVKKAESRGAIASLLESLDVLLETPGYADRVGLTSTLPPFHQDQLIYALFDMKPKLETLERQLDKLMQASGTRRVLDFPEAADIFEVLTIKHQIVKRHLDAINIAQRLGKRVWLDDPAVLYGGDKAVRELGKLYAKVSNLLRAGVRGGDMLTFLKPRLRYLKANVFDLPAIRLLKKVMSNKTVDLLNHARRIVSRFVDPPLGE